MPTSSPASWPVTISLPKGLGLGGVTTWAADLAEALAGRGRCVRLVVHGDTESASHGETHPGLDSPVIMHAPPLHDPSAWAHNVRLYRDLLPTILLPNLSADSFAVAAALSAANADRLRVMAWNHSDNVYDHACHTYYEPLIHGFAAVSQRCRDQLRALMPLRVDDIRLIPYGIVHQHSAGPCSRPPLAGRPIRLLYAGRMDQPVKRVGDMVELARLLADRGLAIELRLIGDGPASAQIDTALRDLQSRWKSSNCRAVRLPSVPRADMSAHYTWADAFLLASEHEGLSIAMIEAMAHGCIPVVSRVASGVGDVIEDGANGRTFPIGDVAAMADAVEQIAADGPAASTLSRSAAERARQHCDFETYLRRVETCLDDAFRAADRPWPADKSIRMNPAQVPWSAATPADAAQRLAVTLQRIARRQAGPVAIYGAGAHTIALADVWARSPVPIVAVVDDDPSQKSRRLWNWPIVQPHEIPDTGARSIVFSSWQHEARREHRRPEFEAAGLEVFRLYGPPKDPSAPRAVIHDCGHHTARWLSGLVEYLESRGFHVDLLGGPRDEAQLRAFIDGAALVFAWNGNLPVHRLMRKLCRKGGIPQFVVEVGFFPQSKYFFLDPEGINAHSSLMQDDLGWVGPRHLAALDAFAERYLDGRTWNGGDNVLVPLQLEDDTNIIEHSPFKTMQAFIDHLEERFSDRRVLIKDHPLNSTRTFRTRFEIVRQGSFLDLARNAAEVYGINSTCLLEAVMLGAPTTAVGDGLLRAHRGRERALLAALVARQIPVDCTDLDEWLGPIVQSALHHRGDAPRIATEQAGAAAPARTACTRAIGNSSRRREKATTA